MGISLWWGGTGEEFWFLLFIILLQNKSDSSLWPESEVNPKAEMWVILMDLPSQPPEQQTICKVLCGLEAYCLPEMHFPLQPF